MKYFKIFILLILSLLIFSCGAVKEGFSNQKKNSSDEFQQKKSPLVIPPDYNELPIPNTNEDNKKNNDIKKLVTNTNQTQKTKQKVDENFEQSILEKIKNN